MIRRNEENWCVCPYLRRLTGRLSFNTLELAERPESTFNLFLTLNTITPAYDF